VKPTGNKIPADPGARVRRTVVVFLLACSLVAGSGARAVHAADDPTMKMGRQLMELRGEVEALSTELEISKNEMRDELRSLAAQKAELEVSISKEELRLKQVRQALEKNRERAQEEQFSKDFMTPLVLEQVERMRSYIKQALPFKVPERLAELDRIQEQVETSNIQPEKAMAQLWAMAEDELRLTRENGLYRQMVVVDDEEMIADVARIGMVMMYFMPADGRTGMVVRSGDGWEYRVVSDRDDRRRILTLFDALKKRIHEGYFELPSPL